VWALGSVVGNSLDTERQGRTWKGVCRQKRGLAEEGQVWLRKYRWIWWKKQAKEMPSTVCPCWHAVVEEGKSRFFLL